MEVNKMKVSKNTEVNTMNVRISKDMEWQLEYFDWDATKLRQGLPKQFPNANVIEVTDCEIAYMEVNVDGEYYVLNEEGEIIESGRM